MQLCRERLQTAYLGYLVESCCDDMHVVLSFFIHKLISITVYIIHIFWVNYKTGVTRLVQILTTVLLQNDNLLIFNLNLIIDIPSQYYAPHPSHSLI